MKVVILILYDIFFSSPSWIVSSVSNPYIIDFLKWLFNYTQFQKNKCILMHTFMEYFTSFQSTKEYQSLISVVGNKKKKSVLIFFCLKNTWFLWGGKMMLISAYCPWTALLCFLLNLNHCPMCWSSLPSPCLFTFLKCF